MEEEVLDQQTNISLSLTLLSTSARQSRAQFLERFVTVCLCVWLLRTYPERERGAQRGLVHGGLLTGLCDDLAFSVTVSVALTNIPKGGLLTGFDEERLRRGLSRQGRPAQLSQTADRFAMRSFYFLEQASPARRDGRRLGRRTNTRGTVRTPPRSQGVHHTGRWTV